MVADNHEDLCFLLRRRAVLKARACTVGSMLRMSVARVVRLAVRKDLQVEYESFNQFGLGASPGTDTAFQGGGASPVSRGGEPSGPGG